MSISYLPVPTELAPQAMRLLADLMDAAGLDGEGPETEVPTPPVTATATPTRAAIWGEDELRKLATSPIKTAATFRAVMDVLADQAPSPLSTSELVAATGLSLGQVRNMPTQVTRHLKAHYGEDIPAPWNGVWGPELGEEYSAEVYFWLPEPMAEDWRAACSS